MALNLVDYSDSDSQADNDRNPPKRVRATIPPRARSPGSAMELPPLPSKFHDLYVAAPRLAGQDDPSLHGGRKRAVPHEVGNWPTFVFLEWHLNATEFSLLSEVIRQCKSIIAKYERQRLGIAGSVEDGPDSVKTKSTDKTQGGKRKERHHAKGEGPGASPFQMVSSLVSDLGAEQPLHVSLSRPNNLKSADRARFVEQLEERIVKAKIKPFDVLFTGFEWVSNFDGTRWFFVITATSKQNELQTLLRLTNSTFTTYRQPSLYSEHKGDNGFHVTIGWSLEAPEYELMKQLENEIGNDFKVQLAEQKMRAEEVKIKMGNVIKVLPLGA